MRLSDLQTYILLEAYSSKGRKILRDRLVSYYEKEHKGTKPLQRVKAITRSIERLIERELMVGYGVRTPHKWYIREIRLTSQGGKLAKEMLSRQPKLPFRKARNPKS